MAWYSKRNRILFLLAAGAVLIGWTVFTHYVYVPMFEAGFMRENARNRSDSEVVRQVKVTKPYDLTWAARDGTPAFHLVLPPADFGRWRSSEHAVVGETGDGPQVVDLMVLLPNAGAFSVAALPDWCTPEKLTANRCEFGIGQMRLHRDPGMVDVGIRKAIAGTEKLDKLFHDQAFRQQDRHWLVGFWIKEDGASQTFQGWDCAHAEPVQQTGLKEGEAVNAPFFSRDRCFQFPGTLARWIPSLSGYQRQNLYVGCAAQASGECGASFAYRGRHVSIRFPNARWPMIFAAMDQLAQWAGDAATPPSADIQMRRASSALANCEAAARLKAMSGDSPSVRGIQNVAEYQCGYAVQLAHPALAAAPDAASDVVIRAMNVPDYRQTLWDRWYADDVVGALAKTGKQESALAIQAHAIVLRSLRADDDKPGDSLDVLLTLIPKVVAADDPLFAKMENELSSYVANKKKSEMPRMIAFRGAWLEKTERDVGPESDLALWIRHHACVQRMYLNDQRATLNDCADRLFDAWQKRATEPPAAALAGIPAVQYAIDVAHLYTSYAYAAQDFAYALASVRRLQAFARTQLLDATTSGRAYAEIDNVERNIAAKAAGR